MGEVDGIDIVGESITVGVGIIMRFDFQWFVSEIGESQGLKDSKVNHHGQEMIEAIIIWCFGIWEG